MRVKKKGSCSKSAGLKHTATAHALRERVKELTCLYGISQISERFKGTPEKICRGIVALIPPAWQYPEATIARIVLDGKIYESAAFVSVNGFQKLSADICINRKKRGTLEVAYIEKKPSVNNGPFLKEERNLIQIIARQLEVIIEREQADEEKEKLQKQLMHADRLATIGQLAAGVAHELNEPLSTILGFAQLARKHAGLPADSARDLDKIVDASLYAREIIKKLLLFARQTPPFKGRVNLNDTVSQALGLFEHRLEKAGIKLVRDLSARLPSIVADGGQLKQVIVNLAANAIQAMPEGGTLTVRTAANGAQLVCTVEDTGTGMTEEILDRIFVPFFTTKDVNQGTGLGLPVVHGIVSAHGGTIEAKSAPGKGTRFTLRLPVNSHGGRKKAGQ